MSKNILFIYDKFDTGGIETLILRMSNWLIMHNYTLTIIMKKKGNLSTKFNSKICIIELNKIYSFLYIPFFTKLILKKYNLTSIDIAMSFHPKSNWIALNIINSLNLKCKYISGIYHPRAYYNHDLHLSEKITYKFLLQNIDSKSLLFMNNDCKYLHEKNIDISFYNSHIWPLPVDKNMFININKNTKKYLIVSIGRLTPFKTYNLYMIDIIQKLLNKGYKVEYHIYGNGTLYNEMQKKIDNYNLQTNIILKGQIDYSQLKEVLQNAYLFVGMGTSAIEASYCKVPSIVAIENNTQAKTHGYLHNLPYYNVGEENCYLTKKNVYDLIKYTLNLDEQKYNDLCIESFNYVTKYSLDFLMPKWIYYIEENTLEPLKISTKVRIIYFILESINPILKLFTRKKK